MDPALPPQIDPSPRQGRGFLLPRDADARIQGWTGPHYHAAPIDRPQGRLVVVLPGTKALPREYRMLSNQAVALGLHVLVLRYPNDDSVNELFAREGTGHAEIRQNVWSGQGSGPIEAPDSILGRLIAALAWLAAHRPGEGWAMFLDQGSPVWSKLAMVGHSLGGGYAFLASGLHRVERAVCLGWADWNRSTGEVAPWIGADGGEPGRRFGLLHASDEMVPLDVGIAAWRQGGGLGEPRKVEAEDPPWGRSRLLVTDLDPEPGTNIPVPRHSSLALDGATPLWMDGTPVLVDAWTWLLVGEP